MMRKGSDSKNPGRGHRPRSPKSPTSLSKVMIKKSDPFRPSTNNALASASSVKIVQPTVSTRTAVPTSSASPSGPRDAKIFTEADVQRMINLPSTSSDFKIISQPPFSDINCVTDYVYLTGMFGLTKEKFEKNQILSKSTARNSKLKPSLIVNATKELPNLIDYDCIRVNVDDDRSEDIYPHLQAAVDRMHESVLARSKVVVHCMAGVSRSSAIVIAYLIRHRKRTLRRAYVNVVRSRPVSRPNSTFLVQLIKFELDTTGTSSTKLIRVKKNGITVELPDFLFFDLPHKFEEEFNSNRAMNRVADCDNESCSDNYPLYDLDKGESIPYPGTLTHTSPRGLKAKSTESLGINTDQQH